jgi:hypothetical protein
MHGRAGIEGSALRGESRAMVIDSGNYERGNRALASVLLLYFHLLQEGGITNDQTVYLDEATFNGFDYLDVHVAPDQRMDIDQDLLREGAVVHLLCELNDMVAEHVDDFLKQPLFQRIVAEYADGRLSAVPEAEAILRMVLVGERSFDHDAYRRALALVFQRYVVDRYRALLP